MCTLCPNVSPVGLRERATSWCDLCPLFSYSTKFLHNDHFSFFFLLLTAGLNSHLLLSILVKHLDHKNIVKQPVKQIDIVNVATQLAQNAKQEASVAIIGAISDLMKHLRRCLQYSAESSSPSDSLDKWNTELQSALEKCILQLSNKVCKGNFDTLQKDPVNLECRNYLYT